VRVPSFRRIKRNLAANLIVVSVYYRNYNAIYQWSKCLYLNHKKTYAYAYLFGKTHIRRGVTLQSSTLRNVSFNVIS
jgi:hypothetical protein